MLHSTLALKLDDCQILLAITLRTFLGQANGELYKESDGSLLIGLDGKTIHVARLTNPYDLCRFRQ